MDKTEPGLTEFLQASPEDSESLAQIASVIWRQHFTPIIGPEQVEYMLTHFQSSQAIRQFILDGYDYFFIQSNGKNIGYLALQNRDSHIHLSKFYILQKYRGQGHGKSTMAFIREYVSKNGLKSLRLVVNKENQDTIAVYEKMGFKKIGAPVTDIGGGYVMDDYEFELMV